MMTVREASARTGVSIRALRYYDRIGLLKPAAISAAGYRLYDEATLARLQLILLYRELQFPLKDIAAILDSPAFDRNRALDQQIELLKLRREHFDNLIVLAQGLRNMGVNALSFEPFDMSKVDQYVEEARNSWADTPAYREYAQKRAGRGPEAEAAVGKGLMDILAGFAGLMDGPADGPGARARVGSLRDYITEHYYACTPEILHALATMYSGDGRFAENIDRAAGRHGAAKFAAAAMEAYLAGEAR